MRRCGPAGPVRSEEVVEFVILGDSTVAGVGAQTLAGSLPGQTAQRVADDLGRPVHVVGHGVSGVTTDQVRRDQVALIGAADVVAVVAGSNDLTHLTPLWAIRPRTRRLLEDVRGRTGAHVVLGGTPEFATVALFPQPLRAATGWLAARVRDRQQQAVADAGPRASFVDIAALASPRFVGRPDSLAADRYRPWGYGYWPTPSPPPSPTPRSGGADLAGRHGDGQRGCPADQSRSIPAARPAVRETSPRWTTRSVADHPGQDGTGAPRSAAAARARRSPSCPRTPRWSTYSASR